MAIIDRYIIKNLLLALFFVTITLAGVIFLSQSLRFLELVMDSGASSLSFWLLTSLALPRFLEVILPLALMVAVVFVYNRMIIDSELIVMRSAGFSPALMARPAIAISVITAFFLLWVTTWLAPVSLRAMQEMRQVIKAQYSYLVFREGVFNKIGDDLTVYVRERTGEGDLKGLMIHDSRKKNKSPVTIIAKSGQMITNENGRQQVLVYDGSRQQFEAEKKAINSLDFDRYTIDLPESAPVRQRWKEPDERTLGELLSPDPENRRDQDNLREFFVEANKRLVSPFLAPAFTIVALVTLLIGPVDRRGQSSRIFCASLIVIVLEGLFLASYNLARQSLWGIPAMYLIVILPTVAGYYLLTVKSEVFRRRYLYRQKTFARNVAT
jgi:lipopolysaccharide export system permease protein